MQYPRPISMKEHPIATKKYIVPTPSIDGLVLARQKDCPASHSGRHHLRASPLREDLRYQVCD